MSCRREINRENKREHNHGYKHEPIKFFPLQFWISSRLSLYIVSYTSYSGKELLLFLYLSNFEDSL